MKRIAIGIDLGCTNIKGVLIDETGNVLHQTRQETREPDDQYWKAAVGEVVKDFGKRIPGIDAVGLCAPGLANPENTCIECMPGRMPGLENHDWSTHLHQRIFVLNDAHAALTAEASFGAGQGAKHAILLTLGSGVGGGILIDGKLYQGLAQMAGHFGHSTVNAQTHSRDVTNMPGSIEDAIGNITIRERSYEKFQNTFELIEAFKRGETFATWLWLDSLRKLAISLASYINILSPEVIILGGGIAQAEDALMQPLRNFLSLYEWRPGGKQTTLKLAHFSDLAGAIGAAAFALSKTKTQ